MYIHICIYHVFVTCLQLMSRSGTITIQDLAYSGNARHDVVAGTTRNQTRQDYSQYMLSCVAILLRHWPTTRPACVTGNSVQEPECWAIAGGSGLLVTACVCLLL